MSSISFNYRFGPLRWTNQRDMRRLRQPTTWEGERGPVWMKSRERERGEERKWWLSDGAGKACLHLNTATTCNQMGGLMRKESCLNTTPRCRAAPTGSTGRPNRECVRVCACWWSTVCNVSDEGLKVDAKSCVTGKHHLGAQRSVDTQSQQEHCYRVFRSNCWKREDFPHIPPSPFLGV